MEWHCILGNLWSGCIDKQDINISKSLLYMITSIANSYNVIFFVISNANSLGILLLATTLAVISMLAS